MDRLTAVTVAAMESTVMIAPPCGPSLALAMHKVLYRLRVAMSMSWKPTRSLGPRSSSTAAPMSPTVKHASRGSIGPAISRCAVSVMWLMYSPLTTRAHWTSPVCR
ncbi:hypothetical protein C1Y40_05725 [Mycobacterium talmoniae]|uniref:Uncharacterized protein n=1 Tax=Mycobacterium talmoniae TaxID=1858794 RepID=A0A2S8BBS7_9MYCO|nr:hypothetical protein C1Y40_05725 [Mycobacterium talmoniae]